MISNQFHQKITKFMKSEVRAAEKNNAEGWDAGGIRQRRKISSPQSACCAGKQGCIRPAPSGTTARQGATLSTSRRSKPVKASQSQSNRVKANQG
jgi:hypothetical protein